jgi:hypothetical protein
MAQQDSIPGMAEVKHFAQVLQHSKCLADALHNHVCWARVKGYPYWPVSL